MIYNITITSKNPKSLKFLISFYFQNKNKVFNLKTKFYKKKQKKYIFTTLKSPHVNKKAQIQLEYKLYLIKIMLLATQVKTYLIFLKKIKSQIFPDIKIKIKIIINKKNMFYFNTKTLNPINFFINTFKTNKKSLTYIKTFDCFGELNLIKNINKV